MPEKPSKDQIKVKKQRKSPPDNSRQEESRKETEKKKLAVGALITFYRQLREISRHDLADKTKVSVSLLGMIENGGRLPSQEVLERLGAQLGLTAYERVQLHAIAGHSAQLQEARGWEVRADDLFTGVPLFLRNMKVESTFQEELDVEECWIISRRPLALEDPVLSMLKSKLLNTDARYVYFVDARFGKRDFDTLWDRLNLESDIQWKRKKGAAARGRNQLTFVLSPPPLCASTHSLALFNPRSDDKPRFGRSVYYGGGTPVGVYTLDVVLYEQLVSTLKEVYLDCEKHPGTPFPKDQNLWGTFRLLTPPS